MKEIGKRTTIICLTALSMVDLLFVEDNGSTIVLWIFYGLYKLFKDATFESE